MQALISPSEPSQSGYRVAEVAVTSFEVASPMFWVACADDVVADQWWYDPSDSTFKQIPAPTPPQQPAVVGAQTL
jgi:hypothetical protein